MDLIYLRPENKILFKLDIFLINLLIEYANGQILL